MIEDSELALRQYQAFISDVFDEFQKKLSDLGLEKV
jgi:hypothetical protein